MSDKNPKDPKAKKKESALKPKTDPEAERLGRVHRINSLCTLCEACVSLCPTQSIFKGVGQFVIDSDTCEGCSVCYSVCNDRAVVRPENFELEQEDGRE